MRRRTGAASTAGAAGVPWIRIPGLLPQAPQDPRRRWPEVGEQSAEILRDVLGLRDDDIQALRDGGALPTP